MEPPASDARQLIKKAFGISEVLEGLGSERRKHKRLAPACSFEHRQCLLGQVHDVRFGILGPCFWDRPNLLREIQLIPT